eukprot:1376261-Rhodomonas_salina.1
MNHGRWGGKEPKRRGRRREERDVGLRALEGKRKGEEWSRGRGEGDQRAEQGRQGGAGNGSGRTAEGLGRGEKDETEGWGGEVGMRSHESGDAPG